MPNQVIPDDIPLKDFQVIYKFNLNLVFKNKLIAVLSSTIGIFSQWYYSIANSNHNKRNY